MQVIRTSSLVTTIGIALIMGVDRILDMSRTAINVCGDLVACVLMNRWITDEAEVPEETVVVTSGDA